MSIISRFKAMYGVKEKPARETGKSVANSKIAVAVREVEKRGFKYIAVYRTGSTELKAAIVREKEAGRSVFGVKAGNQTILFNKKKKSLAQDLFGAAKVASKGMGEWADRVAPSEKPKRKTKAKTKTTKRKPKRIVKRTR